MNGPSNCDCHYCDDKVTGKGEEPCEYFNHHCDHCHKHLNCTEDECIRMFDVKYKYALSEIEKLWKAALPGTPDGDRFEELSKLIVNFESKRFPIKI